MPRTLGDLKTGGGSLHKLKKVSILGKAGGKERSTLF